MNMTTMRVCGCFLRKSSPIIYKSFTGNLPSAQPWPNLQQLPCHCMSMDQTIEQILPKVIIKAHYLGQWEGHLNTQQSLPSVARLDFFEFIHQLSSPNTLYFLVIVSIGIPCLHGIGQFLFHSRKKVHCPFIRPCIKQICYYFLCSLTNNPWFVT